MFRLRWVCLRRKKFDHGFCFGKSDKFYKVFFDCSDALGGAFLRVTPLWVMRDITST